MGGSQRMTGGTHTRVCCVMKKRLWAATGPNQFALVPIMARSDCDCLLLARSAVGIVQILNIGNRRLVPSQRDFAGGRQTGKPVVAARSLAGHLRPHSVWKMHQVLYFYRASAPWRAALRVWLKIYQCPEVTFVSCASPNRVSGDYNVHREKLAPFVNWL